jgi:hypothetical protein
MVDLLLVIVRGEHYHIDLGAASLKLASSLQTIEAWQVDVHDHHIRRQVPNPIDGLLPVTGLTDHFKILSASKSRRRPFLNIG